MTNNQSLNNNQTKNNFPQELRCQICYYNYWTLEVIAPSLRTNGKFCQPCSLERIANWYSWTTEKEATIKQKRGWDLLPNCR
jgi:hypothetical protein